MSFRDFFAEPSDSPDFQAAVQALMVNILKQEKPDAIDAGEGEPVTRVTRVYRAEFPNGHGPFNSGRPDADAIYHHICDGGPGFDCARLAEHEQMDITSFSFRQAHGHAQYGCPSLDALKAWFPEPSRKYLAKLGCKVIVYEIPRGEYLATVSDVEIVFNKEAAHRIQVLDFVTLEESSK